MKTNLLKHSKGKTIISVGGNILFSEVKKYLVKKKPSKTFVFIDRRLRSGLEKFTKDLKSISPSLKVIFIDSGETLKNFDNLLVHYRLLSENSADRKSVLIAIGGGAVGDAIGFLAATYMRGLSWISVPTTLLGQVDSGIGGKTGVNFDGVKNLIGSIHQPDLVVCDVSFLKTLPDRELISGFGEILKYGLSFDEKFFVYLEKNYGRFLARNTRVLEHCISKSIGFKVRTVNKDEFETKGLRMILNFGHTVAHAIESELGHGVLRHGEAVILGMKAEVYLAYLNRKISQNTLNRVLEFFSHISLPKSPRMSSPKLIKFMKKDKKNRDAKIAFILLDKKIGKTILHLEAEESLLKKSLDLLNEK